MQNPKKEGNHSRKKILVIILTLTAIGLLSSGGYILYQNITRTDAEGYALSNTASIKTPAYAFALWLDREPNLDGQLKFIVKSTDPAKSLFVGYAKENMANDYVQSMEYANPNAAPGHINYDWDAYNALLSFGNLASYGKIGVAPARPPAGETFWLQRLETDSTTTLYWDPVRNLNEPRTLIVIMNSDGSKGVQADLILGYKQGTLSLMPYVLLPLGLIFGALGLLISKRR
jgi:hypothetical protein